MAEKKLLTRREMCKVAATGIVLSALNPSHAFATPQHKTNTLPEPDVTSDVTLVQALKKRKSSRKFSQTPLPAEVLSRLLWAANGVNRPDSGKRTAPSAWNWQNIDIYIATAEGVFLFDAEAHRLIAHLPADIRKQTGTQGFVGMAPVNLIYVANYKDLRVYDFQARRHVPAPAHDIEYYSIANAGFISQNVYLFAAAEGLVTVVRGLIDKPALAKEMKLRPEQHIILAQTIGYPHK